MLFELDLPSFDTGTLFLNSKRRFETSFSVSSNTIIIALSIVRYVFLKMFVSLVFLCDCLLYFICTCKGVFVCVCVYVCSYVFLWALLPEIKRLID